MCSVFVYNVHTYSYTIGNTAVTILFRYKVMLQDAVNWSMLIDTVVQCTYISNIYCVVQGIPTVHNINIHCIHCVRTVYIVNIHAVTPLLKTVVTPHL